MKLENIHKNIKKGSKRSLSREQLLNLFENDLRVVDENTKYHVNDEFYFNADKEQIWTISKVIGKFNIEGFIEPQMYEISSPVRGSSWNVVYKTVTEQYLDTHFTQIDSEEPNWDGDELNESFLKEEEVEVHPLDQAILDTKFYKVGHHYVFWPSSKRPAYFVLERMFISSSDYRVNCHVVYEKKPGETRIKKSSLDVTETYVSLSGMEEMRQRGDLQNIDIEEPESDGSEFDESYESKNKKPLNESSLNLAFQPDECLPNTNFPKSWMTDTPSNHDQLYGFYDNGWTVSKFNPLTDLTIFKPKNNFVFNINNNALKEGMVFILSTNDIKLLEIVKINIRTVNVREKKTDNIYPIDKSEIFLLLLNNNLCVMNENIEEPEIDGSDWDE